jgi:predicted glycosyltransferase involved in capsule biosynthesis
MITFVSHLRFDHQDRIDNLNTIIDYYASNILDCKFIFVEDDKEHNKAFDKVNFIKGKTKYMFIPNEHTYYRTRALNIGIQAAESDVVVSMDTDCIVSIEAIARCTNALLRDATVAWPYNGYFIDVGGEILNKIRNTNFKHSDIVNNLDGKLKMPLSSTYKEFHVRCTDSDHLGTGGFVMFNKNKFLNAGGYNENCIGWGCEDNELVDRLLTLGHEFYRSSNPEDICFHLYHRSAERAENPFFHKNGEEWRKVKDMSKEELESYISKWRVKNGNV